MTTVQLKEQFLVSYDIKTNFEGAGYEDSDLSVLFNRAQMQLINQLVKSKLYDQLKEITIPASLSFSSSTDLGYSFYVADLTSLVVYIPLSVIIKVSRTFPTASANWYNCEFSNKTLVDKYLSNGLNKPFLMSPLVYFDNDLSAPILRRAVVLIDSYSSLSTAPHGSIEYITVPTDINFTTGVTSVLNAGLHPTLVELAVELATTKPQPQ